MMRLAVVVGAGLLAASPASADPTSRRDLEAAVARIIAHQDALSRLWPGFWPEGQPFIIHHPETGAVFAGDAAPEGPEFRPGALPGAVSSYELDYPSGVVNTVALKYDGDVADLETLFHEQFHDHQTAAFRWLGEGSDEFVDVSLIPDLAGFAAAAEIERRILAEALNARRPDDRRRLAARYLTLRHHRLSTLDPAVATAEAYREWSEGTAEYVGVSGGAIVAGRPDRARARIVEALRRDLNDAPGGFSINWFRGRAYGVGAALAWLLDDLGVDWRADIETGAHLDARLAQALGEGAAQSDPVALLRRYGHHRLRQEMAGKLARAPQAPSSREEFLAGAPLRLAIHVAVPPVRASELEMSFHAAGMTPLPDQVLALTDVSYLTVRIGDVNLWISDRSVLTEMVGTGARQIVLLSSFVGLEPLAAAAGGEPAPVDLDLGWFRLKARAATVEVLENEIRLHLVP